MSHRITLLEITHSADIATKLYDTNSLISMRLDIYTKTIGELILVFWPKLFAICRGVIYFATIISILRNGVFDRDI